MDPLTALSLAGNIIQFVDFGGRLLGGAGEIYHSAEGSLKVHDELELVATDEGEVEDREPTGKKSSIRPSLAE